MGFLITHLLRLQDFAIDSRPQLISVSKSQSAKLIKNGPPKLKWTRFQYNGWLMMLHSGWVAEVLYIVSLFSLHHCAMYIVGTTSAKWVVWVWTFWYKFLIFNDLNNHQLNVLRLLKFRPTKFHLCCSLGWDEKPEYSRSKLKCCNWNKIL